MNNCKPLSDGTLMSQTKRSLIERIRCLEADLQDYDTRMENQAELLNHWRPEVHAHWKLLRDREDGFKTYECSRCGRALVTVNLCDYPYCHCGAKMDEEVGENGSD